MKRKYVTKTYHTFICSKCGKNALKVPARGNWNVIKTWTCPDCIKKELMEIYPNLKKVIKN